MENNTNEYYGYIYITNYFGDSDKMLPMYIGQHKGMFDESYHGSGTIIKRIVNKHPDLIQTILIDTAQSQQELDDKEIFYIKYWHMREFGYNIAVGGYNTYNYSISKNKQFSEERRRKISEALKGNKNGVGNKSCSGQPAWNRGKSPSEETRRKMSEAAKRRVRKPCSEETRRKISEANKGKPSHFIGKHHSEETKRKISESEKSTKKLNKNNEIKRT